MPTQLILPSRKGAGLSLSLPPIDSANVPLTTATAGSIATSIASPSASPLAA